MKNVASKAWNTVKRAVSSGYNKVKNWASGTSGSSRNSNSSNSSGSKVMSNPIVQRCLEGAVDTTLETVESAARGEKVNLGTIATSFVINTAMSGDSGNTTKTVNQLMDGADEAVDNLKREVDVDLTIMSRNSSRGNPGAITHFDVDLNTRQQNLLQQLPEYDSSVIVNKGNVNLKDLSALTAKTGDEFAMFTRGSQRMVLRGDSVSVPLTPGTRTPIMGNIRTQPQAASTCVRDTTTRRQAASSQKTATLATLWSP